MADAPAREVGPRVIPGSGPIANALAVMLFLAIFLYFWVSISPFVDLTNPMIVGVKEGSNVLNQAISTGLFLAALIYGACRDWLRFRYLLSGTLIALLIWMTIAATFSIYPDISYRRFTLALFVLVMSAVALTLPRSEKQFATLLAIGVIAVLALSYGGVALLPEYSIHNANEILEPEHAGNWRGPFGHKNAAGAAMVYIIIVGLYVTRRLNRTLGWGIILAAAIFLWQSQAKTAIGLFIPSLLLTQLALRARSSTMQFLLLAGGLAAFNLITVGSVIFPPIYDMLSLVMNDPTFTRRSDIWSFAIGKIMERPITGYGFEAFWGTTDVYFGASSNWANRTTDAHNGYVDFAIGNGIVGVILLVLWVVIRPLGDLHRSLMSGNDPALTEFYLRVWTYALYSGCLESFAFKNGHLGWFMLLLAVFGLRFQASTRLVVDAPKAAPRPAEGPAPTPA